MAATTFNPVFVFIPDGARWMDGDDQRTDPKTCVKLQTNGDGWSGELFTEESINTNGPPSYRYERHGLLNAVRFVTPDGADITGGMIGYLPDMHIVKDDETEFWDDKVKSRVKRIFGVYAVNRRNFVYICSSTPSMERLFLGYQYEPLNEDDEKLEEEIRQAEGIEGIHSYGYVDVSDIEIAMKTEIEEGQHPPEGKRSGGYRVKDMTAVTDDDAYAELEEFWATSCP